MNAAERIGAITLRLDRQRQSACLLESTATLLVLNPTREFAFVGIEALARSISEELEAIGNEVVAAFDDRDGA
jgi:hypothetical protein